MLRFKLALFVTLIFTAFFVSSSYASSYVTIGKGCTNAWYIDEDCDGYGVASPNGPDADDSDPSVNTYTTIVGTYGPGHDGIKAYLTAVKGLDMTSRDIYYLDPTSGNDVTAVVNDPDHPWQSFNGTGKILALMSNGDICMIKAGTHTGQLDIDGGPGTSGNPIYIYGWPGSTTFLEKSSDYIIVTDSSGSAHYTVLEDFGVRPTGNFRAIRLQTSDATTNLTFRYIEGDANFVAGTPFFGMGNMHDILIEKCVFHSTKSSSSHGIYLGCGNGINDPNSNIAVRGCLVYKTYSSGIQHNGRVTNLVIEDCIVHSNVGSGLAFLQGVRKSYVRNNIVFNNTNQAMQIYNYDDSQPHIDSYDQDSNTIINNTFWVGQYNWQNESNWPSGHAAIAIWDTTAKGGYNLGQQTIRNNLLITYGECGLWTYEHNWVTSSTIENNIFYRTGSGTETLRSDDSGSSPYSVSAMNKLSATISGNDYFDPDFESAETSLVYAHAPGNFNFVLKQDSQAINFGVTTGAPPDDLREALRSGNPDAGCYEYGQLELVIATATLASGAVGVAYKQNLSAQGGTAPYDWSIITGSLPGGLSLDLTTGVISGIPGSIGTSSFTVRVTDTASGTATKELSITINVAPALSASGATNLKVVCDRWPDASSLQDFGESSATLMSGTTNEEKAIGLWRWIQSCTNTKYDNSIIAREPAYGTAYELDPVKLLNVYGVHWCDGLSRIMEMTWRKMGYRAEKYYKWGHTMADIWYEDADNVERSHLFDVSQHWFLYTRDGSRIASGDDLMCDYSLISRPSNTPIPSQDSGYGHWGYVHAHHLPWPTHDMGIDVRGNESFERLWSNVGLPYYNVFSNMGGTDFEHGPYQITYGNGKWICTPDFTTSSYKDSLYSAPQNLACIGEDGQSPNLHPATTGSSGVAIFKITNPYIISDATISGTFVRNNPGDNITFSVSVDDGSTWKQVYQADQTGSFSVSNHNIAEKFDPSGNYPAGLITPFGHYEYLLKIELSAATDISDCGVENLTITTVTQHNIFSLPQLWPGRNTITVTGDIASDTSLRITYVWDDNMGNNRQNVTVVENTPYTYKILTDGNNWEDVVCKSIKIEAVPWIGNGNQTTTKETAPQNVNTISPTDAFITTSLIGSSNPSPLKTVAEYVADLNNAISAQEGYQTDDPVVWGQTSNVQNALWGLSQYGSVAYSAKDDVINTIKKDRTAQYTKAYACQTLYTIAGSEAVPTLKLVLSRDPSILWADDSSLSVSSGLWINTCGAAAAILGQIANTEAKSADDDVENLLDESWVQTKCGYDPNSVPRWSEFRWAFVKALGKLGNSTHGAPLRAIVSNGTADGDERALAARSLGQVGDTSAVDDLLSLLSSHDYAPLGWYCIESIGKVGTSGDASELYPYLNHWDENYRCFTAEALGRLENSDAVPYLESLIAAEPFTWVTEAAQNSVNSLSGVAAPTGLRFVVDVQP